MTQTWLYRSGLCALVLLPVAHLTSLGVMEMAGFLLFVASLGLFLTECIADTPMALSRIRSTVALPILGYSIVTMVSAFVMLENVDDQLAALRELKWVIYVFAFAYFLERYGAASWSGYFRLFLFLVTILSLFAIAQFLYGWEYPRADRVVDPVASYFRVTGLFNVSQSFAGNMGMAVFFMIGVCSVGVMGSWASARPILALSTLAIVLGWIAVVLTLTRSAWFAGALVLIVAASRLKRIWGLGAVVMVVLGFGLTVQSNGIFAERLLSETGPHRASIEHRQEVWEANWQIFKEHPLLGIGPGQNVEKLDQYFDAASVHRRITSAHNNFLEVAASRGTFALLCYCAISLYFLAISLRVASGKKSCALLRAIATGSLLAQIYFHVLGVVDSNFFDREVKNMLTFLWAITLAAAARLKKTKTKECALQPTGHSAKGSLG